jgi:hypothetical protein
MRRGEHRSTGQPHVREAGCRLSWHAGCQGRGRWRCEQIRAVAAPLPALIVGLCKGNYLMHWESLGVLTTLDRVAGWASTREQIGLWRMCVTTGILRGVCAFLC